jgi:glycine cleavage system H protein
MSDIPGDLKYAKSHEWVRAKEDTATIGITDHAQHELPDVVSVKTASDIYAPVSGEVTDVNKAVVDNPALVNTEPYAGGWFFKIKLTQPSELNGLMTPAQYGEQIKG